MKLLTTILPTIVLLSITATANFQSEPNAQRSIPVAVGDIAPDFALEDQNRDKVTLAAAREKRPVVLVFYRGSW